MWGRHGGILLAFLLVSFSPAAGSTHVPSASPSRQLVSHFSLMADYNHSGRQDHTFSTVSQEKTLRGDMISTGFVQETFPDAGSKTGMQKLPSLPAHLWRRDWVLLVFLMVVVLMIAGLRSLELSRIRLRDQIRQADFEAAKLKELNQLKSRFFTNISHELRTPVTVLRGSLEALKDQVVTEPGEVRRYYDQMLQESIGLQRLVNDLLDLSRLQSPDFPLDTAPFELSDLIQDLCRSIEPLAQKKGVVFQSEVGRPFSFKGDYGRVRQMLMIVLDNGLRLTPVGNNLGLGQEGNKVWIADEGPGISPEERPMIFERFYKGRNASGQEGSGLGLSIAKEIAQRHQIQIQIESQPGQGSRFLFTFPSDLVTEVSALSKV